jgi:monovalent cation:H+ antiporter-2, CPA2 family
MQDHGGLSFLGEIVLFLVLAGVLIPLLARLRVNQVLGFLVIGCLFGPFGLGSLVTDYSWLSHISFSRIEGVRILAELGIVFLMFTIGLELSVERLIAMRHWVFGVGSMQVVITGLVIGLIAYSFGNSTESAVILGMVLSFSSTAVVMQLLVQRRELGTPMGRGVFSVLLLQDLAVVPMIILVSLLGKSTGDAFLFAVLLAIVKAVVAIGGIYLLGRRAIRPLFHHLGIGGQTDTFMALTLLAILGIAALTAVAGLSMALGAFLAGLLLAETEYRHEVEVTIEPFKGLLMGLFFMSVGMNVDPAAFIDEPIWLPLSVIGLILIKSVIAALSLRIGGLPLSTSVEGGLLLGQGGEFAFIVVAAAITGQLIDYEIGQFMLLVVGCSMIVTPLLSKLGSYLQLIIEQRWPSVKHDEPDWPADISGHVVIAGFGRVGQLVASVLDVQQVMAVIVEQDTRLVRRWFGHRYIVTGDASRPELLRKLHIDTAAAVIITMDHTAAALRTVHAIRKDYPNVPIVARARDESHAVSLRDMGATLVVPETLESGLQLSGFALSALGVSEETTMQILEKRREERIAMFRS